MPKVYCCVTGCSNSTYQLNKWKGHLCRIHHCPQGVAHCTCSPPFQLFTFPRSPAAKEVWVKFVNRRTTDHRWKRWEPNKNSRICSSHFVRGQPTEQHPFPTLNAGYTNPDIVSPRRSIVRYDVHRPAISQTNQTSASVATCVDSGQTEDDITCEQIVTECMEVDMDLITHEQDSLSTQAFNWAEHSYSYRCSCSESCSCRGCEAKDNEIKNLQDQVEKLTLGLEKSKSQTTVTQKLLASDQKVSLYTGLPTIKVFNGLFDMMKTRVSKMKYWHGRKKTVLSSKARRKFRTSPKKQGPCRKLPLVDEYLLTLMKLRLASNMEDLADRFRISASTASSIFNTWLRAMSTVLKGLIFLPPTDVVLASMPQSFKDKNCKTRVIIDCTEVFINRPRNLQTQALTWSDYKHSNTVKFLVGITPHGHVAFVSKAWGGRTPDQYIVKASGFLDLIDPGDEVMADRGFQIKELLLLLQAKLTIPPSSKGKQQMSSADVKVTKHVANLRIHVERAINRIKWFRILKHTLPLSLVPCIDDIICVCAALCNLRLPLVSR